MAGLTGVAARGRKRSFSRRKVPSMKAARVKIIKATEGDSPGDLGSGSRGEEMRGEWGGWAEGGCGGAPCGSHSQNLMASTMCNDARS